MVSPHDQDVLLKKCEYWLSRSIDQPQPSALVRAIKAGKCNALSGGIKCVLCGPKGASFDNVSAYYRASSGRVILCADRLSSQAEVTAALIHELVHAYDHCRVGLRIPLVCTTIPYALQCATEACSEVRAYSLANYADTPTWAGKQTLVYRSALASMLNNKASDCRGDERCAKAIAAVLDSCAADAAPFNHEGRQAERKGRFPAMVLPLMPPAAPPPASMWSRASR